MHVMCSLITAPLGCLLTQLVVRTYGKHQQPSIIACIVCHISPSNAS